MVTEQQIKVVIADDQDIYRDGLQMLLSKDKGIKVIAEASNGRRLAYLVKQFKPDVVLTDLGNAGDGRDTCYQRNNIICTHYAVYSDYYLRYRSTHY